jgi:hypothetical protein
VRPKQLEIHVNESFCSLMLEMVNNFLRSSWHLTVKTHRFDEFLCYV